eukprot:scaffold241953_cov31-Tisochrysis_lutea.AAC.1
MDRSSWPTVHERHGPTTCGHECEDLMYYTTLHSPPGSRHWNGRNGAGVKSNVPRPHTTTAQPRFARILAGLGRVAPRVA